MTLRHHDGRKLALLFSRRRAPLAPDDTCPLAPALILFFELPLYLWREVTELLLCRGMFTERRSYQIQPRSLCREPHPTKVPVALELAQPVSCIDGLHVVPAYANPVVQPLHCQLQVFVSLQLNDRKPSIASHAEQIEHAAVGSCKCRHLGVHVRRIQPLDDNRQLTAEHTFQPALRLHAVERIVGERRVFGGPGTVGSTALSCRVDCSAAIE